MSESMVFLLIFFIVILIAIISQMVASKFKKNRLHYSSIPSSANITGAQVVQEILDKNNIKNVRIERDTKEGRDHYNPYKNVINLSPSVYDSSSIAALAIASHEAGHAIQWGKQELGIRIRDFIAKPVNVINQFTSAIMSMWLILLIFGLFVPALIWAGLIMYASTSIFQIATLPVEFGASRKAKRELKELGHTATQEEIEGTEDLLKSAAMTYVVATLSSIIMFVLYLLLILARRNN